MRAKPESSGDEPFKIGWARVYFEQPPTGIAMEVVMMALAGDLVSGRLARQFYRREPTLLRQRLQVPVHGRQAHASDFFLTKFEHLRRAQRAVMLEEDVTNGAALARVALSHSPYCRMAETSARSTEPTSGGVPREGACLRPCRSGTRTAIARHRARPARRGGNRFGRWPHRVPAPST